MNANEGLQDRTIRCLIGLTVTIAAMFMGAGVPVLTGNGLINLFFLLLGIEVLATGVTGWSPLYAWVGFSTNGRIGA